MQQRFPSRQYRYPYAVVDPTVQADEPADPRELLRFIAGRDATPTPLTREEVRASLHDPFTRLVLQPEGASGPPPISLRAVLATLDATPMTEQRSFVVADGGQVAWSPETDDLQRNFRLAIVRQAPGDQQAGRPDQRQHRHRLGDQLPAGDRLGRDGRRVPVLRAAVRPLGLGRQLLGRARARVARARAVRQPHQRRVEHEGAEVPLAPLAQPVRGDCRRRARARRSVAQRAALDRSTARRRVRAHRGAAGYRAVDRQPVRAADSRRIADAPARVLSPGARHVDRQPDLRADVVGGGSRLARTCSCPLTFLVDVDALLGTLELEPEIPDLLVPAEVYRQCLARFDVCVSDGRHTFAGDTHFVFVVPEPAFEDILVLEGLIARGVLEPRLAASLLMVDCENPVFSPRRASLAAFVPRQRSSRRAGGVHRRVRRARSGERRCRHRGPRRARSPREPRRCRRIAGGTSSPAVCRDVLAAVGPRLQTLDGFAPHLRTGGIAPPRVPAPSARGVPTDDADHEHTGDRAAARDDGRRGSPAKE